MGRTSCEPQPSGGKVIRTIRFAIASANLRDGLTKIWAKVVSHARQAILQIAEMAVQRELLPRHPAGNRA